MLTNRNAVIYELGLFHNIYACVSMYELKNAFRKYFTNRVIRKKGSWLFINYLNHKKNICAVCCISLSINFRQRSTAFFDDLFLIYKMFRILRLTYWFSIITFTASGSVLLYTFRNTHFLCIVGTANLFSSEYFLCASNSCQLYYPWHHCKCKLYIHLHFLHNGRLLA